MKDYVYSECVVFIDGIIYRIGPKNNAQRMNRIGKWQEVNVSNDILKARMNKISSDNAGKPISRDELFSKCYSEGRSCKKNGVSNINPYGSTVDEIFKQCSWSAGYHGY